MSGDVSFGSGAASGGSSGSLTLESETRKHVKCGELESDAFIFAGVEHWTVFDGEIPIEINESQEE